MSANKGSQVFLTNCLPFLQPSMFVYDIVSVLAVVVIYIVWVQTCLRCRSSRLSNLCLELGGVEKPQDLRAKSIQILSNLSVVASLLMTIQFALVVVGNNSQGIFGLTVYYVLICSLLSSALSFIISVHVQLALITYVITDEDADIFFSQSHELVSYMSRSGSTVVLFEATGYDNIGVATAAIDGSFQWLFVWGLLWIINNLENSETVAGLWFLAMIVALTFVEFCYRFLDSFVKAKLKAKSGKREISVDTTEATPLNMYQV